ncbi:hypothetical protein [Glaciimonas sp. PAMC28666]|uniref:hypothetical protein n=1 Tax=Glaciimonas sp. PAMC28666 TaxID=2807626 RepID=UPI001963ED77|nr:hypothetical protein [Glaciimonas sp. PAMC28666]QRX82277.1 hypothetical protein JQN73_19640 [Glaciimonas sp. PAMC28666]
MEYTSVEAQVKTYALAEMRTTLEIGISGFRALQRGVLQSGRITATLSSPHLRSRHPN